MTMIRAIRCSLPLHLRWILFLYLLAFTIIISAKEDLYQILGVKRTATTQEIKKAYRRKARDTHPDKVRDKNPEEAAEGFRQVTHAFEILSDPTSRRRYDQTGSTDQQQHPRVQFYWNFYRRPTRLKDRFEVQEAQSRVLHVVSLEQLGTVMLDENDCLERNLFMSFVVPGDIETLVNDEMVFPFPFAAMSSQGIWWEDLLQTVQVRFHKHNDVAEFFQIPPGDEYRTSGTPIFLFLPRGAPLHPSQAHRIQTRNRNELENWMWQQIEVQVQFVNDHDHPVEVYWIHGSRAQIKLTLQPGEVSHPHTTMLSHEWYVRDARVDQRPDSPGRYRLTADSSLGSWKILNDTSPHTIVIERQTCFDLSGHCAFWQSHGECQKNPVFMHEQCRKTCGVCVKQESTGGNDEL